MVYGCPEETSEPGETIEPERNQCFLLGMDEPNPLHWH